MRSKLLFSEEELSLVNNTEWLFTKQKLIQKVFDFFGDLKNSYAAELEANDPFPEKISSASGKISRGENYRGLPYVILDYPAKFGKDGVLALRTMFWWGNFFSITLHISGVYKSKMSLTEKALEKLQHYGFFISGGDEWEHHFEEDNYRLIQTQRLAIDAFNEKDHFKIAKKTGLDDPSNAGSLLIQSFREIVEFLSISYPNDRKDP